MTVSESGWLSCVADEIERACGRRPSLEELFDDDSDLWEMDEPAAVWPTPADLRAAAAELG